MEFKEEEILMDGQMKSCLILLGIRELQSKITMRYCYTPTR